MTPSNFQIDISKTNLGNNFAPVGSNPQNLLELTNAPLGNAPAKFHRNISRTVACQRVRTFETRKSSTFDAMPPCPLPRGSGAKFFLHIFPWVRAMTHANFQIDISQKIGGKISPRGSDP